MLWIVSAKLEMGMVAHSSSLNFYRRKEKKYQQNLKCHKQMEAYMEMECKWNSSANGIPILNKQKKEGIIGSS